MKLGLEHLGRQGLYQDYLRRLDAQAVLDHYGAENQRRETGKDGTTEVVHSCLLDRVERHHAHGDGNPSAACNLDKKLYVCYSYWGGDLLHLVQKMEGKDTIDGVTETVARFLAGATADTDDYVAELEGVFRALMHGDYGLELPSYSERILAPWAFVHPYLAERGIDHDTASRLQIGWDEATNRITIPHFWDHKLVGWQARAIPDRPGQWPGTVPARPKYKNNPGFPKSETLYGYDMLAGRDHAIVVESPFSVVKAAALGVGGVVATFGAKVSSFQVALLRDFERVTVWMDDDPAGRLAERRLVNQLHRHTAVRAVPPDLGRDLGDCDTAEEADRKLSQAEPAILALMRYDREAKES